MIKINNIFIRSRERYADEMILEHAPELEQEFVAGFEVMKSWHQNMKKERTAQREEDFQKNPVINTLFMYPRQTLNAFHNFFPTHPTIKERLDHLETVKQYNHRAA